MKKEPTGLDRPLSHNEHHYLNKLLSVAYDLRLFSEDTYCNTSSMLEEPDYDYYPYDDWYDFPEDI